MTSSHKSDVRPSAIAIDQGRPENLEAPRQTQQGKQADLPEADTMDTQVDRYALLENPEREALGEIKQADPEELGSCPHGWIIGE